MGLLKMFSSKEENPFFTKLKKLNSKQNFAHRIERAFFLGGVVYTNKNYENLVNAISSNELGIFLENNAYDTQRDNIELYWMADDTGQAKILVILDPLELYDKEEILNTIPSTDSFLDGIITKQQIYPNP
jgi:hypothetical protein